MLAWAGVLCLITGMVIFLFSIIAAIRKTGAAGELFRLSIALFLAFGLLFTRDSSTGTAIQEKLQQVFGRDFVLLASEFGNEPSTSPQRFLTDLEFREMYANPNKFKGARVEFYAKVYMEPDREQKGFSLRAYGDPLNEELNMRIDYDDPDFRADYGDYIHVIGTVKGEFHSRNLLGGELFYPWIWADEITISDYISAVSPAIKTVEVNQEIDQHGYVMKLQKIEFSEIETRVYLEITNHTNDNIHFDKYKSYIIQGSSQFKAEANLAAKYKNFQSKLFPGVKSEGIISFAPIDPTKGDVKFIAEGNTENGQLRFDPFEFVIPIQY